MAFLQATGTYRTALAVKTQCKRCNRCSNAMLSTPCYLDLALTTGPCPPTAAAMGHRRGQLRVWHAAHLPVRLPGRAADVRHVKQGGEGLAWLCTAPSSTVHLHAGQVAAAHHIARHGTTHAQARNPRHHGRNSAVVGQQAYNTTPYRQQAMVD